MTQSHGQLMRSYMDILNENKTNLGKNKKSNYEMNNEDQALFNQIFKILNLSSIKLTRDGYQDDRLTVFQDKLKNMIETGNEMLKIVIHSDQRSLDLANFFLKDRDSEIHHMISVMCEEILKLGEQSRDYFKVRMELEKERKKGKFNFLEKKFINDTNEMLETIKDIADQIYNIMYNKLKDETVIVNESQIEEMFGKKVEVDPLNNEMTEVINMLEQFRNQEINYKEDISRFIKENLPKMEKLVKNFYGKSQHLMTREERVHRKKEILAAIDQARLVGQDFLNKTGPFNLEFIKNKILRILDGVIRRREPEPTPPGGIIDHRP